MSKTVRRKKTKEKEFVVGILTMPHASGQSHIMAAYVGWLESEGVTVVPVPYDTEDVELYFQVLHGLVIPGGDTQYVMRHEPAMLRTIGRFLELAMRDGEHFPVWSVCLGYEIVMAHIGGFKTFEPIQDHIPRKLGWTAEGERSGMYKGLGKAAREETEQNHEFGVSPERFTKNIRLRRSFQILATEFNEKGEEYIAIVQAKKWPIYGVMFHPERQENRRAFARVFLEEVRKCRHPRGIVKGFSWGKTGACRQYPELAMEKCYFFS